MKSQLQQLGKDSLIYGIGGIIAKSIGFFLLPVYTRIFAPAEYGMIEMLTVLNSFLGAILVTGMDAAQSFYFFKQKRHGLLAQAKVVSAILQWRILWGTTIVISATFISPLLNHFFFNGRLSWQYFALAFAGSLFSQIMIQSAEVLRLQYKPVGYITIILGKTLLSAGLMLIFILVFGYGIAGFFGGSLIGALSAAFWGWWRIRAYLDWSRWHLDWWPRLLRFGGPLVPAGLIMYVLNTSDRWFVNHFNGPEALGLYAVGAKFSMVLSVAVITFRRAWWPVAMDAIHSEHGKSLFRVIARLYLGLGVTAIVLLTSLSPYLVRWIAAPEYFEAYPIVGILSWYVLFYGFYLFCAGGIWKAEKTVWSPLLMGIAALLNIVLNAWLVPIYSSLGAAVATSISFFVWNILSLIVSEKLWRVGYDYMILLIQVGMGAIACYWVLFLYKQAVNPLNIWFITCLVGVVLLILSISRRNLNEIRSYVGLRIPLIARKQVKE